MKEHALGEYDWEITLSQLFVVNSTRLTRVLILCVKVQADIIVPKVHPGKETDGRRGLHLPCSKGKIYVCGLVQHVIVGDEDSLSFKIGRDRKAFV